MIVDQVSEKSADEAEAPMPFLCCAADRTYGTSAVPAGLYEDVPGAATARADTPGIHWVEELFGMVRYHWRFPDSGFVNPGPFTAELGQFYASLATQNCPASGLVRLHDVVLAGSVLYANASTDPSIVYETYRPNDRPAVRQLSRAEIGMADRERFSDASWRNIFIGSAGSSNYGHWLVDDLPRLKAVTTLMRIADRPVRVLIHSYGETIDQIRRESVRMLLGPAVHIDLLDRAKPYHFDELHYVTPVSLHPVQKSPIAIDFVARAVLLRVMADTAPSTSPTLLFVDRAPENGRTLANHHAIRQIAESHGFVVVDPAELDFTEQARLFGGAQVVVGPMGAAMTNTLFCRPSTTLIYLAPSGWIEPFYWDLSVVRGHYYRIIYGDVTDPMVSPHQSDFTIDPDVLEHAIAAL